MRNNKLDLDFAGWLWAVNRNKVNEYYYDNYAMGSIEFRNSIGGQIVKEYFNENAELLQTAFFYLQINWNTTVWSTYPETFKGGLISTKTPLDIYDFTWLLFKSLAYRLEIDDINGFVEGDWRSLWKELDKKYGVK